MLTTKQCKICKTTKQLKEFYKHKNMKDGYLSKCKICSNNISKKYRVDNPHKIRKNYLKMTDEERSERYRKQKIRLSKLDEDERKRMYRENSAKQRKKLRNTPKYIANTALNNAVRDGRIVKLKQCEHCGIIPKRIEGHHHDYSKPLDVTWLCPPCHGKEHRRLNFG